jgi:hypothetical protein
MVRPVEGEFKPIVAELEKVVFFELRRRGWAIRVAGLTKQALGLHVAYPDHVVSEDRGCPDVVGVEV